MFQELKAKIYSYTEKSHLALGNWTKLAFGQFYRSRVEVLQIAQLLNLVSFVSVSLLRENLRGLKEDSKHKILTSNW